MDHSRHGACHADDARRWRSSTAAWCAGRTCSRCCMQCFMILCLISVQWVLFGYSSRLRPGPRRLHRRPRLVRLCNGVGLEPNADYAATIPHQLFMIFQMMFAVITPALIIGAFAERMKFSAFLVFTLLWATFVYDPVAHWVWGVGGWLRDARRARLRRRHRGAHQRRHRRARRGAGARQAQRG